MRSAFTIFATLGLITPILAIPANISTTLETRETYQGQASTLTITTYGDAQCAGSHLIWPNVKYGDNKSAQVKGFAISRPLVKGEQLDFSNSDCSKLVGPVYGLDKSTQWGAQTCFNVGNSLTAGCFNLWHH